MASSVHPFQASLQSYDPNAPPQQSYSNPTAYGAPPSGYGYGANPNVPAYPGAPPLGYAYGPLPGNGGFPHTLPSGSAPPGYQGSVPPSSSNGYPSGAAFGMQSNIYSAPNAAGYILETGSGGGAMSYPPGGYTPGGYTPGGYTPGGYPPGNNIPGYPPAGYPPGRYPPGNNIPGYPPVGSQVGTQAYPPPNVGSGGAAVHPIAGASTTTSNATGGDKAPAPVNPRDQIETNRWAAGLCACCDHCVPNCCFPWLLPFVSLAQIYARLGVMAYKTALTQLFVLYAVGVILTAIRSSSSSTSSTGISTGISTNITAVSNITNITDLSDFATNATVAVTRSLRTYTRSYHSSGSGTPIPLPVLAALAVLGQIGFRLMVWHARRSIRKRFRIPGDWCSDCVASLCCSCCAIAQMATHIKSYRPGSCSLDGPSVLPACIE